MPARPLILQCLTACGTAAGALGLLQVHWPPTPQPPVASPVLFHLDPPNPILSKRVRQVKLQDTNLIDACEQLTRQTHVPIDGDWKTPVEN